MTQVISAIRTGSPRSQPAALQGGKTYFVDQLLTVEYYKPMFKIRSKGSLLVALFLISLAMVLVPVWLIHPFRPQTTQSIRAAYLIRSIAPVATLIAAASAVAASIFLWRRGRWLKRVLTVFCLTIIFACAWFARQNHFEWMFRPLPNPSYAHAHTVDFVDPDDMILAVNIKGDAVAYPVRQMAYHHIVHDTVGGQPLVATY